MTDYLRVDGVALEYGLFGPADTGLPTLVLLHEGLGCVAMWKDFPRMLAERTGHPVFVYSRQGYGRSDPRPAPWPLTYMHEEGLHTLPRVLDAAGLDNVVLVGHSDGASMALVYAGGVSDHRARSLVLMAPHVFNEPVCVASIEQARIAYDETNLRDRLLLYHGRNVDNAFRGWNGAWLDPGFLEWNIEQYLSGVSVPALLLQGAQDQYGTLKQIDAIEQQVRGPVRREIIDHCRHSPYIDQPERVLELIGHHLAES